MSKGLTRKELNRFLKKDLMKIARDNNMPCNSKDSKRNLVDCIFKNKDLRKTLTPPPKRAMSEKQKENLKRFRLGKGFKNEEKIKQEPQLKAEERKLTTGIITPASVQPKTNVIPTALKEEQAPVSNTELKTVIKKVEATPKLVKAPPSTGKLAKFSVGQKDYKYEKIIKQTAQYDADLKKVEDVVVPRKALVSNNKEISNDLQDKIDMELNLLRIDQISNMKIDDSVVLRIMGDHQKQNKRDFNKAKNEAMGEREGGLGDLGDEDLNEKREEELRNKVIAEKPFLRDDQIADMEELIRLAKERREQAGNSGGVSGDEEDLIIEDSDEDSEEEKAELDDEDRDFLTMTTDIISWEQIVSGLSAEERKRQFDQEETERKNKLFLESILHRSVNKGFINPRDGRFVRFDSPDFERIFNSFKNNIRPRELELLNDFISREKRKPESRNPGDREGGGMRESPIL